MIKGLLSPASTNSQPQLLSPTGKSGSSALCDSHSTLYSSRLDKSSQPPDTKFCSFRKIKEMKVRQRSEQGRVIKQYFLNKDGSKTTPRRVQALDDAKTIVSFNSSRSSHLSRCAVEESIIIMRGGDLQNEETTPNEPTTPFFRRRNTFTEETSPNAQFLKVIRCYPALLQCIESGLLCHFQISKVSSEALEQIKGIRNEGVLQIFTAQPLNKLGDMSLVLYEPYTETLSEMVGGKDDLSYKNFIAYLIDIVKILSHLGNSYIFPDIEPSTVVLANGCIKLKIRPGPRCCFESERETLKQCGYYFSMLMSELAHSQISTPTKMIGGLTIRRRLQFECLMTSLIRDDQFTIDEAYIGLQDLSSDILSDFV